MSAQMVTFGDNRQMAGQLRCRFAGVLLEAATGVEPVMEVLQTSALPLGYAARERRWGESGAGEGTRTLDLLHGKQTL